MPAQGTLAVAGSGRPSAVAFPVFRRGMERLLCRSVVCLGPRHCKTAFFVDPVLLDPVGLGNANLGVACGFPAPPRRGSDRDLVLVGESAEDGLSPDPVVRQVDRRRRPGLGLGRGQPVPEGHYPTRIRAGG
jgi:hypothetical protein